MKKVVAIDYGRKRIGIAISYDRVALPLKVISVGKSVDLAVEITMEALKDNLDDVENIVVGLPLLLNGQEGEMALEVREFAKKLEKKVAISVILLDERLTSLAAIQKLKEINLNRKKRSKMLDSVSATIILQNFLDREKNGQKVDRR